MLVTGGPGTGKTAVLLERFARLLEAGADPERVALVVGTRRAHAEARDALLARFPGSLPELRVVTIHGLARHVVNARFRRLDYPEPPELLPAGEQFALVQELLERAGPRGRGPRTAPCSACAGSPTRSGSSCSRAQEALLTPEDIRERAQTAGLGGWIELARFYRRYLDVLDDRTSVDFAGVACSARRRSPATASRCSTTCWSTTTRTPRSPPRRSSSWARRALARGGGRPRRARVLVPGDHRRADPAVHRAVPGRRRTSS